MCPDCAAFFDTPDSQHHGLCPICRRNDIINEKLALERVRNDFWIKAEIARKKARNKAFTALAFCIICSVSALVLEWSAHVNLLKLIGAEIGPFKLDFVNFSLTLNTIVSIIPVVIGTLIFVLIISSSKKKNREAVRQGNAYELSRYELDKSLDSINTALVKNRSNTKRL
jgi:hypothetical protein